LKIKCELANSPKKQNIFFNSLNNELKIEKNKYFNNEITIKNSINKSSAFKSNSLSIFNERQNSSKLLKNNFSLQSGISNTTRKLDDINLNLNDEENYFLILNKLKSSANNTINISQNNFNNIFQE
jgi:hypothetical protein